MPDPKYGWEHQQERAAWAPLVATGTVTCRRAPYRQCVAPDPRIAPHAKWDLGHPDETCPAPTAPEHFRCNRRTMAADRRAARAARANQPKPQPRASRRW